VPRRFTEKKEKEIVKFYLQNKAKTTCSKFNITQGVLLHIRNRAKVGTLNKFLPQSEKQKVVMRYTDDKQSMHKIAQEFGVSHATVYNILKTNNIKRRTISEASYKGARHIGKSGYVLISMPNEYKHFCLRKGTYAVLEHQFIMMKHLNRKLHKHENIHHINGNRADNRLENLELWSRHQPYGQRVVDKIRYAKQILKQYKNYKET
jgi:transposase-like protein